MQIIAQVYNIDFCGLGVYRCCGLRQWITEESILGGIKIHTIRGGSRPQCIHYIHTHIYIYGETIYIYINQRHRSVLGVGWHALLAVGVEQRGGGL